MAHKDVRGSGYTTCKDDQPVSSHPSNYVESQPEWLVYNEFVLTTKNWVRTVTKVEEDWIIESCPSYWSDIDEVCTVSHVSFLCLLQETKPRIATQTVP